MFLEFSSNLGDLHVFLLALHGCGKWKDDLKSRREEAEHYRLSRSQGMYFHCLPMWASAWNIYKAMPHVSLPFLIAQCSDVTFVGSSQDFSSMHEVDDGTMPQSPSWVVYIKSNLSNTSWGASATCSEINPRAGSVRSSWSLLAPTPVQTKLRLEPSAGPWGGEWTLLNLHGAIVRHPIVTGLNSRHGVFVFEGSTPPITSHHATP